MTKLTASDGHSFDAYEVRPDDAAAAVVVIQEIFGVNEHIRSVVDRYAAFGYHAIAPALFDRVTTGVELGYDQDGMTQGREMAGTIRWEPAMLDLAATVAHVSSTGPVGSVGYCFSIRPMRFRISASKRSQISLPSPCEWPVPQAAGTRCSRRPIWRTAPLSFPCPARRTFPATAAS